MKKLAVCGDSGGNFSRLDESNIAPGTQQEKINMKRRDFLVSTRCPTLVFEGVDFSGA